MIIPKSKGLTRKDIKEWLKSQDTSTRYKPTIRTHKFYQTRVTGLVDQLQLDLVDMG